MTTATGLSASSTPRSANSCGAEAALLPDRLAAEASGMRSLLGSPNGKLMVHLAMEDDSLYPRLLVHSDATVRATAHSFADEMAGMKLQVQAFGRTWTAAAIRADPAQFCTAIRQLFSALGNRIAREDGELYALVDRLG